MGDVTTDALLFGLGLAVAEVVHECTRKGWSSPGGALPYMHPEHQADPGLFAAASMARDFVEWTSRTPAGRYGDGWRAAGARLSEQFGHQNRALWVPLTGGLPTMLAVA